MELTKFEQGHSDNRVHVVFIGDGYTAQDLEELYIPKVEETIEYITTHPAKMTPYPRYKKFINFYRIDLESPESGVDKLSQGIFRNTPLGGEDGCTDYTVGVCGADWQTVHDSIDAMATLHGFRSEWRLTLLNDDVYNAASHYAGGRNIPIYSAHHEHDDWIDIALHEAAHAWHKLADEYGGTGTWNGTEPSEVNVTADPSGAKWSRWIGYQMPSGLEVGVFEGARYTNSDLYRPSTSSKMNRGPDDCHASTNDCGHNMIGIEKIIHDIYEIVDPVDSLTDTSSTLIDPQEIVLELVDPEVSMVDWIVDGDTVLYKGGEVFSVADFIAEAGTYTITARVWDEVIEHAFSDNANPHPLDLVRKDLDKLEKSISWSVTIENILQSSSSINVVSSAVSSLENISSLELSSQNGFGEYESSSEETLFLSSSELVSPIGSLQLFSININNRALHINGEGGIRDAWIELYTVHGKRVFQKEITDGVLLLDAGLSSGAYYYKLTGGDVRLEGVIRLQ